MAILFSDVNLSSPQVGKDDLVYEIDCIRMCIFNLISTNQYDRPFRPDVYANLENLLFDPMTEVTTQRIRNTLLECLPVWEPRIVIDKVNSTVIPDYTNELYQVMLIYSVPALDNKDFLNFNLSKGR